MKTIRLILIMTLMVLFSACAVTPFTLVEPAPIQVEEIILTPSTSWNKVNFHNEGNDSQMWTKDGAILSVMFIFPSLEPGEAMFKSPSKELPMPAYEAGMLPNEIVDLVKTSFKNLGGGQLSVTDSDLRPQDVAGETGFRFSIDFFDLDGLAKKGDVLAVQKDGNLNLLIYSAAKLHYFDKYATEVNQMFNSVRIASN